jgi:hypothetical protein
MTPSEKEHFRWQFAGQAMQSYLTIFEKDHRPIDYVTAISRGAADALIRELEKTAPEHGPKFDDCVCHETSSRNCPVHQNAQECEHDFRAVKYNAHGLTKCTKCGLQSDTLKFIAARAKEALKEIE